MTLHKLQKIKHQNDFTRKNLIKSVKNEQKINNLTET